MGKLERVKEYRNGGFIGLDTIGLGYIDWLIEQAERVRALEKANEILERTLTAERCLTNGKDNM